MHFRLLAFLLLFYSASAQQKLPSIEEKTIGLTKYDGYLTFYWDDAGGKIWLEISQMDSALIYQTSLPAGIGSNEIGLDRGLLGNTALVKFSQVGRKILLLQTNAYYRANTAHSPERIAVEQSFAQSALWGFTVEAESNGHYLVDATDFFLRDAMKAANRIKAAGQGSYTVEKTRSAIYLPRTKNFPANTELEATITLVNNDGNTGPMLQGVTPSPEAITIRMHHSFVQLPDGNYQPREFDARSGFIPIDFFDYSTPIAAPIEKFYIIRHRLQKKNPGASLSDPVAPIVYYLDNGTPEPIRSALLKGAAWWNQAFEAAGYRNAFQVRMLPDSADPMDIRYNMINWVHRSTRGWSYGAAVVDPRTGEIIKGQVTLGSLRVRQDYLIAQGLLAPFESGSPLPDKDDKMLRMALERLQQLAAHEIGHTLGLMHNYASSANNRASVMDYPPPMVRVNAKGDIDLKEAYSTGIGDWDKSAITWGYGDFSKAKNQPAALDQFLADASNKQGLQFISDRDARPAGGLHPQAHLWDNGSDAIAELAEVIKVRQTALAHFSEKNIRNGQPMAMLEDVLVPAYLFHRYQLEAVTKMIGGMYYSYALRGDGQTVTRPVSREEQLKALHAVIACLDPAFLALPPSIVKLIPPRPAGYGFTKELFKKRTGLAFDAMAPAETAADFPLSFLFNSERLSRMSQYEINGGLGVPELLSLLIENTWKAKRLTGMEYRIQLQTEQLLLTYLLALSVDENCSFAARGAGQKALADLKLFLKERQKTTKDEAYADHLALALERMKAPDKAKPTVQHREMPAGAPIGCDMDE